MNLVVLRGWCGGCKGGAVACLESGIDFYRVSRAWESLE